MQKIDPEQILLGSLLGDGCISLSQSKDKHLVYSEGHSLKQKDYFLWKLKHLKKLFNFANSPYYYKNINKLTISSSDYELDKYKSFYKNKIRILNRLTPVGLAVWYMDDGCYAYREWKSIFSTNCFNYKEHLIIQRFFKKRFNILPSIIKHEKSFRLIFSVKETIKFLNIIKPYMHESMIYKLGNISDKNNKRIKETKIKRNKYRQIYDKKYYLKHRNKILKRVELYRKNNLEKCRKKDMERYWRKKRDKN